MGCFLGCFGKSKNHKQRRCIRKSPPNNQANRSFQPLRTSPSPQKPVVKVADVVSVPELSPCRKKVTFDLNLKSYEDINDPLENEQIKEEVREEKEGKVGPDSNYRYRNCESSDEEEEFDSEFDDEDDYDEGGIVGIEEESYDSYFSIPVDDENQKQTSQEVDSPMPTTNNVRDRSQYVHPVLNPVENLSQWKEVKQRAGPPKNPNKEHVNIELGPNMKTPNKENDNLEIETKLTGLCHKPQKPIDSNSTPNSSTKQEISVDASLSTWLVSSETQGSNSHWSNSSVSREEQPILGALTVEDLKHSSVTSSPRRSPSRNPDEVPILGTVGCYWSCRDQNNSDTEGIQSTLSTVTLIFHLCIKTFLQTVVRDCSFGTQTS